MECWLTDVLDPDLHLDDSLDQAPSIAQAPNVPQAAPALTAPTAVQFPADYYKNAKKIKWRKRNLVSQAHQLHFHNEQMPQKFLNLTEPMDFLSLYLTDDFISSLTFQSNLYARQKGKVNVRISEIEIRQFLGILLFSSVIHIRNFRLYWHNIVGVPCIRDTMPQKKFESIRSYFHFTDNSNAIEDRNDPLFDRLWKVRPILTHFNKISDTIPMERDVSVDEHICATKMKTSPGLRQYNPKKPHKWGFKIYMLCGTDGFIHTAEIYSGQENKAEFRRPDEPDLGSCSNVVVRMCRNIPRHKNHRVYFDNYFNSIPLIHFLKKHLGIQSLGTMRRDRIGNDRLPKKKALAKVERGKIFERMGVYKGVPISVVLWKDNQPVTLVSSYVGKLPVFTAKRYSRAQKRSLEVQCPAIVSEYNRFMGGVDLLGSNVGRGKVKLKSRKWTLRIFYHFLDLMVVNAWIFYRRIMAKKGLPALKLRPFRIQLASSLTQVGTFVSPSKRGRPATTTSPPSIRRISVVPPKAVRRDQIGHTVETSRRRQRCKNNIVQRGVMKRCHRLTNKFCVKCTTYLCITSGRNCFNDFHQ